MKKVARDKEIKKIKDTEEKEKATNREQGLVHQIIWYMIIFSILGLIVETVFGYIKNGVIESRKGLIIGPFCPIYGVGAVIMILILGKYKGHPIKLFVYGALLGNFIEYLISFILEAMYGSRFWSYTYFLNLNGRVCLLYGAFWGILAVVLIDLLKPQVDKIIYKIKGKSRKILDIILTIFFLADVLLTIWALHVYRARARDVYYDVKVFEEKNAFEEVGDKVFTNSLMGAIFPNLRLINEKGEEIWITDILSDQKS